MITRQIVAYLISMAVGYWVLTLAGKEKGNNQKIGKVIAWIIIIVSFFGPLCLASCRIFTCSSNPSQCNYMTHCPMDSGSMPGGPGAPGDKAKSK